MKRVSLVLLLFLVFAQSACSSEQGQSVGDKRIEGQQKETEQKEKSLKKRGSG